MTANYNCRLKKNELESRYLFMVEDGVPASTKAKRVEKVGEERYLNTEKNKQRLSELASPC